MRVRPIVTLTMAGLLLGACGSSAKSAAPEKPTTTSTSKVIAASKAASTPVTDLNGHAIVGVKAQDVVAESVPDKPLDPATHAVLAAQLVEARTVAMKYPTVADATAAGYHLVGGGFGPGSGAHYIGGGGYSFNFDPNHPLALIYDGINPTSQMVGLMYYSMGALPPDGFAGPNDHWHRHSGVCLGNGGDVLFPPDSDVTAVQCANARLLHAHNGLDGARMGGAGVGKPEGGVLTREPRPPVCRRHVPHRQDRTMPRDVTHWPAGVDVRTVVLVEGISDQFALEALAERRGRDLHAEGISIVPMGGATNIRSFLDLFGPSGLDVTLAGLCDAGEEGRLPARSRARRPRLEPQSLQHGIAGFLRVRRRPGGRADPLPRCRRR